MTVQTAPAIGADELDIVRRILRDRLPPGARVWVFGSRATGQARRYSDIDLAIDAGRRLTFGELADLTDAFRESDLPCKVDVVDWQGISEAFRARIAPDRIPILP